MTTTINASTSGGLVQSADTSGILQLQTAGTAAVTIDASQRTAFVAGTAALPAITTTGDTNTGIFFPAADTIAFSDGGVEIARFDSSGNFGIGVTPATTGALEVKAGTATVAPVKLNSGTSLTSAVAGTIEYDGVRFYGTADTTSGRGYVPSAQIFRLAANGSAIGPAINNFFGANSAVNLSASGAYELEAYLYFTKTTAGTVTITLTSSVAVINLNGTVQSGAIAGGVATGAANQISLFASASTAAAFGASGSLTTGVNHAFVVRAVFDSAASASNMRVNITSSAGTVTPLRNSYYKLTRLPAANTGSFAA